MRQRGVMSTRIDRHTACLERLPRFVSGALPQDAAAAVVTHTSTCPKCRAELDTAQRLNAHFAREWGEVAELLEPPAEQAEFDRLWTRIATEPDDANAANA